MKPYVINLDFKKELANPMVKFTLGDKCSIEIHVFDEGEEIEVDYATISINGIATKPIDVSTMTYTFGDEIEKAGFYRCNVQVYKDGRNTTCEFSVQVLPDKSVAESEVTRTPTVVEDIYMKIDNNRNNIIVLQEEFEKTQLTEEDKVKLNNLPLNTIAELDSKVDKVAGKGLSTNDYTNEDKAKVANLPEDTISELSDIIDELTDRLHKTSDLATQQEAEEGQNVQKWMNPLRVKQAIEAQVGEALDIFDLNGKIKVSLLPDSIVHSLEFRGTIGSLEAIAIKGKYFPTQLEKGWLYITSYSFSIANRLTTLEIPVGEEYETLRSAWNGWTFTRYDADYEMTTNFLSGDMFIICDIDPTEKVIYFGYIDNNASDLYVPLTRQINGKSLSNDITLTTADIEDLVADNISFDGSGTNFLAGETNVEGAIKELDTRVKNELDSVKNGNTIEEKAIKPFQTSFLELGKNIFNKDTVIDGYRVVTSHGNLVETPGYTASQFIEVKPNTKYVWNLNTTNDTICFYDENKTYIPSSGVYGVTSFTTPANCYFIRVSFLTERFGVEQKTIAQIELGDTPTAYEPYFEYKIDGTKLNTNSVNVSSLDNELKQILIKSNEIYGFNFDFNGSLLRSPVMPSWKYNENRFEVRRNSVAYDDNGNEIGPNLPVYRNVDFRRKGITQMEATTNLLTEANSISFSTPETISLNPGTYTLSFNKGNGSISISGYPDVTLNNPLTFTLSETANILLTPNGVVEMAQLEMKPYATYWQKGGIPRVNSSTRIFLDEPINTEFGIGVRMQMNQDSTVIPTGSDENWRILHIYKDADNFIEVNLRPRFQYLVFTYRVNGVTTQIINYNVTYKKDEPFEVYIHVIPNNSMFIYYTKNGVLHQKFKKADSIAIPPNFTQVALAHRLVLPTQDSNINNSIITNFKLERGLNCNPQRYFKEVLL